MLSLLIRNAQIIDGSGSPGFQGDLAVEEDRIVAVGRLQDAEAERVIDGTGKVLCPGFIDVHTHSELAMLTGQHTAGVQMGVTTEFICPDGFCFAPLSPRRLAEYRRYLFGIYGDAEVGWDWRSFREYLEHFEGQIINNIVPQVPHGAVRLAIMGWSPRAADSDELAAMRRFTIECMEAGSVGLNAGLDYAPAAHSDLHELVELARVVQTYGGVYSAHIRGYDDLGREAAIAETVAIAERAEIGVHISHFSGTPSMFASLEAAQARGIDITFDAYPYMAGCTFLSFTLPRTFISSDISGVLQQLGSAQARQIVCETLDQKLPEDGPAYFASLVQPNNKWMEGMRVRQAWHVSVGEKTRDISFADFVCNLLIDEELAPLLIYPWGGEPAENEQRLRYTLTHPLHMMLTDGIYFGRYTHPRGWGAFARLLALYVREKRWLSIEDAIRRMTGFPAMRYGLVDRGFLRKDMAADLVIFDPQTIQDQATFDQPRQPPLGIEYVFVNGVAVIDQDANYAASLTTSPLATQSRPGRIIRLHGG